MAADDGSHVLRQWLAHQFSPSVLVLTTPKAEEACRKNGVDFCDLVRPFAHVSGINVGVQIGEAMAYVRNFSVNLVRPNELTPRNPDDVLARVVERMDYVEGRGTPWYDEDFRSQYFRFLGPSDHEFLLHPIACLSVISSADPEPVKALSVPPGRLPPLFRENFVDSNIHTCYVLVHDRREQSDAQMEAVFQKMKEAYGIQYCKLLRINSVAPSDNAPPLPDMWVDSSARRWTETAAMVAAQPHVSQPSAQPGPAEIQTPAAPMQVVVRDQTSDAPPSLFGACLSPEDRGQLDAFMRDFILKNLLPFMDRRVQLLNTQVEANRRGVKNSIRAWWGRKPKALDQTATASYPLSTVESQIRQLADFQFFLRHYELALANYRLVSGDFKNDHAQKHHAGSLEMIGLCLFMLDQGRRECIESLDLAYNAYLRSGNKHLAARVTVLEADIHRSRGLHKESALILLRCSGQENSDLRAALWIEQAAFAFMRLPTPGVRKFAFHLVLAGHRYSQANQRRHSSRCYMLAGNGFENKGWSLIEDHINFTLGRLCAHLGDIEHAVQYFVKLLGDSQQPVQRQTTFLKEFMFLVKALLGEQPQLIPNLPLPRVCTDQVMVYLRDSPTDNSPEWDQLRFSFSQTNPSHKTVRLPLFLLTAPCCVMWEEVYVDIEVSNPMQIPIDVTECRLICDMEPTGSIISSSTPNLAALDLTLPSPNKPLAKQLSLLKRKAAKATHRRTQSSVPNEMQHSVDQENQDAGQADHAEEADADDDGTAEPELGDAAVTEVSHMAAPVAPPMMFEVETQDIKLAPTETKRLRLFVRPRVEGTLHIRGLEFKLGGVAPGKCNFVLKGQRLNKTKAHRQSEVYEEDKRTTIKVVPAMPLLDVQFTDFPMQLLEGEHHKVIMTMTNRGHQPACSVKLRMSHPDFFVLGATEHVSSPQPGPWGHIPISEGRTLRRLDSLLLAMPTRLDPGESVSLPIWLRGRRAGRHQFRFLFCYDSDTRHKDLPYRFCRKVAYTEVLPAVSVQPFTRGSSSRSNEYLLGLEVSNTHDVSEFMLRQVSCLSSAWSVEPLSFNEAGEDQAPPEFILQPRQSRTYLFRLLPVDPSHRLRSRSNSMEALPAVPTDAPSIAHTHGHTQHTAQVEDTVLEERPRVADVPFYGSAINASVPPLSVFYHIDKTYKPPPTIDLSVAGERAMAWAALSAPKKKEVAALPIPKCPSLDLMLLWQCNDHYGQVNVCNIRLAPETSHLLATNVSTLSVPSAPTTFSTATATSTMPPLESPAAPVAIPVRPLSAVGGHTIGPIKFVLTSARRMIHDFSSGLICEVPVTLSLFNPLTTSADFYVETLQPTERDLSLPGTSATSQYVWAGATRSHTHQLQPQQRIDITLLACFTSAGVFNVNRLRIGVKAMQHLSTEVHFLPYPHYISLEQST
eukprot:TRINITY_DN1822_c0_g1_i2.p1 TRINITY_DN1822_c0_g1~~TRINITY_DN1822_c0_g1_i2.p1  ORF type:complete len:1420 (-),score=276.28 TRINITY_DN1822_c0_g1_i2:1179-5438(-)